MPSGKIGTEKQIGKGTQRGSNGTHQQVCHPAPTGGGNGTSVRPDEIVAGEYHHHDVIQHKNIRQPCRFQVRGWWSVHHQGTNQVIKDQSQNKPNCNQVRYSNQPAPSTLARFSCGCQDCIGKLEIDGGQKNNSNPLDTQCKQDKPVLVGCTSNGFGRKDDDHTKHD